MGIYVPSSKRWMMWRSMRAPIYKRLRGWNRSIYEKVQGYYTKRANHKRLEREKSLARSNDDSDHKRSSRDPGIFIKVAGMPALEMQVTGSKYVYNTYVDTDYGTTIGVDNRLSGCISNIMDDFVGPLV